MNKATKNMKSMKLKNTVTLIALTAGAITLISACATSSGYKQADKTGAGIAEFRDEIVNGKKAIDATMKSLSDIAASANTDPRKAFEQYSKDVSNLESTAAKIRKRAQEMQAQGQSYFKKWEQELATVSNPEIRTLAEQRKAKLQATFEDIRKYSEPLKAQFEPWMSDLKDLQRYLSNDLTIGGVDAAKGLFKKTTNQGSEVQKSMDALVAELNTVAATITPAKATTK
jgi:chromosome segregation ATPase